LFILQLPLLLAIFVLWIQGTRIAVRDSITLATTLVATTIIVCLPSLPFRLGRFEFYTLSWFHLYIAAGSAIAITFMAARNVGW
jgi:hypothetical protein